MTRPCRACTRVDAAVDLWHNTAAWAQDRSDRLVSLQMIERYEKLAALAKKARERGRHFHLLEADA